MPIKDPIKRREYRRQWYAKNKESEKKHVSRRKKEILRWFEEYKKSVFCRICNENHPAVLDFHHRDKSSKELGLNVLVHEGYSKERIKKELIKCDVLCSNCHRKLHYDLRNSNI